MISCANATWCWGGLGIGIIKEPTFPVFEKIVEPLGHFHVIFSSIQAVTRTEWFPRALFHQITFNFIFFDLVHLFILSNCDCDFKVEPWITWLWMGTFDGT